MKKNIKESIKKNKIMYELLHPIRVVQVSLKEKINFLKTASLLKIDGRKLKYPKVIQLPITYNCNAACVMCNIWKMDHTGEMSVEEFSKYMQDPLFKYVEAVGINGGEPSLVPNLYEYADEILKLPRLSSLNIISHGLSPKPLFKQVEKIYLSCKLKGVKFHISISLDGVGEIHNTVRGRKKAFDKTKSTIDEIILNQNKYCDSYDIGCTVIKQNVDYLMQLDGYAKQHGYNIRYRLGIDNKRIESDKLRDQFSVIYSPLRQSAKEFFHYQKSESKNLPNQFKNFAIFEWLCSEKPKRLLGCAWKDEGITLDARGELYYCAVASKSLGSLRKANGKSIFFDTNNIDYRKEIVANKCNDCIHDYHGQPELKNLFSFFISQFFEQNAMKIYKFKTRLMF